MLCKGGRLASRVRMVRRSVRPSLGGRSDRNPGYCASSSLTGGRDVACEYQSGVGLDCSWVGIDVCFAFMCSMICHCVWRIASKLYSIDKLLDTIGMISAMYYKRASYIVRVVIFVCFVLLVLFCFCAYNLLLCMAYSENIRYDVVYYR